MIINANSLHIPLANNSVQCVVTSPPYYGLRDYGNSNQIGLEPTPEEYVANLVQVFQEVKRVLKDDGTLWLNIGDSYAGGAGRWGGEENLSGFQAASKGSVTQIQHTKKWEHETIKPKDLIGIPWMVAFALRSDGWYLRQDIIWAKPNPMPESVKDRCTKSHEYIFLLSKKDRYYYDNEAVKEDSVDYEGSAKRYKTPFFVGNKHESGGYSTNGAKHTAGIKEFYGKRNKRSVWNVNVKPYKGAHFATFPPDLIEPCILAGSKPGDMVLDPFCGSGTTVMVANKHGRNGVGIDLNYKYLAEQAMIRTNNLQVVMI